MSTISIAIADSQFLIRVGLAHLVSEKEHFNIVGDAEEEEELLTIVKNEAIDVVILDYKQDDTFSCETITKLKKLAPKTNILVISADNDKQSIYHALELGVNSYLTKSCNEEEIFDAITATAKGEKFFCNKVLDYIMQKSFPKVENCAPTPLSVREREVVYLIAKGHIAKEIAQLLNISTHTVYTHRKNIMKKLELSTSSELILYAVEHGIIDSKNASK
ncbi:MAG: response regulator [Saprospiraceae bacterium]